MRAWTSNPILEKERSRLGFDPRAGIGALVVASLATSVCYSVAVLACIAGVFCLGALAVGLGWREIALRLLPVNLFMSLLWLTLPFFANGQDWITVAGIEISFDGVKQVAAITLKANALVLAASALLTTAELGNLAVALAWFGVPVKMVWLVLLTHRYIRGLADTVYRSALAVELRSAGGRRGRITAYGGMFAKAFVNAHFAGSQLHAAMLARGMGSRLALSRTLRWRKRDSCLVIGIIAASMAWLVWERGM